MIPDPRRRAQVEGGVHPTRTADGKELIVGVEPEVRSDLDTGTATGTCVERASSRHPSWTTTAGALCVSASAVFITLARTAPGTVSFYRCVPALSFLAILTFWQRHSHPPATMRQRITAWLAGALLAGDMLLWARSVAEIGAGPSTVVVNMQVVLVPLIALVTDREPVTGRFLVSLPFLILGVSMAGGVFGGTTGDAPWAGVWHASAAALCYAGFLFLLRRGGQGGNAIRSMFDVTISSALASAVAGALWQGLDLTPGWIPIAWLLALAVGGQVIGWLLVATSSPHLPSHASAVLLLLTPLGALALGAIVLGERPNLPQLAGCALVLVSIQAATRTGSRPSADEQQPRGRR
jgi:drug/metabolite transporter (DMT)-like permease